MTRLLEPVMLKLDPSVAAARAQSGAARWGLAVLRAHLRSGRLPATLDEVPSDLAPDLPLDPISAKPFIYRPDADGRGFVLYSVGLNRVDDGGDFRIGGDRRGPGSFPDLGIRWKIPETSGKP